MTLIQQFLYLITSGLMIPCVAYLLFLLGQSLVAAGQQIHQKRFHRQRESLTKLIKSEGVNATDNVDEQFAVLRIYDVLTQVLQCKDKALCSYLITEFEASSDRYLNRFINMAKLGPITGLVGTLIPMGPALQGLADGNIQQLAAQMQIAFTTTVIGLIIGAIGLILFQMNKREVVQELALLDFILDRKVTADESTK
ncbi:MotA/TolQ/ExbB proton channel family protein [Aliikangiella sp. IMCC44359]|uniref:MotA/TolQ/ExbB proton channel family protein n=1 Tax=Aliikangiella sp. IMCC44359 TaxID=3459125 RepID=UPI00403B162D